MLQNSRRGMKASLSEAMARVTREPAQLGLGHDTQCAWSNGAVTGVSSDERWSV